MAIDNPSHRGQADPGTRKLGRRVQPLESAEQLVHVCHVEAGAIVADEVSRTSVLMRNAEFDPCLRFINGELPCVAEQILEHHPEQARIAVADDAFADDAFDAALRRGGPESPPG